jgi:hypothetical protein
LYRSGVAEGVALGRLVGEGDVAVGSQAVAVGVLVAVGGAGIVAVAVADAGGVDVVEGVTDGLTVAELVTDGVTVGGITVGVTDGGMVGGGVGVSSTTMTWGIGNSPA